MLEIEDETMQTAEKQDGYGRMVGKFDNDSVALEVDPAVAGGYRPVDRPDVPFNKKLIYSGSRDQVCSAQQASFFTHATHPCILTLCSVCPYRHYTYR